MIPAPPKRRKRHKMTVACDISAKVRKDVEKRDSVDGAPCCIFCGSPSNLQAMHYIPRSQGGLGIPENLAMGCDPCHDAYDDGGEELGARFKAHLMRNYPDWGEKKLVYDKHGK